ncbi:hypothetical protein TNCV_2308731 [Trichonephila clavipes]|nr:hypothetical protein TNCV_2308731 [Trichonephila clavipes]
MANNGQTNLAVINTTNQTPNEPYIVPFDSENGMLIEDCAYKRDEKQKTRLCIDYRKLNAIFKTDTEPLPRIVSLLDKLNSAKYFSTIDFASGYWNIPLHDKEKLDFITTEGLYEFQVPPFGFQNAPAIFNCTNRKILTKHKCSNFACHYFDDIVTFSKSLEEHYAHLRKIFQIFEEENIKLKFSKCVSAKIKINFLGYETNEGCIAPDNKNIETIKKIQHPKNVKQLQSFLASVNVYNRFIDSYAKITEPLNQLLKKDKQWDWTAECQTTFESLKNKLITKPVLQLYDPKLPLHVFCDSSLKAIGAILKQPDSVGTIHLISYHSRTLRDYEKNYCITELKCLAIVDALVIDHATHYVWAFASKSETTETYANCLKQLVQIQIPIKLLTDRNGAFTVVVMCQNKK